MNKAELRNSIILLCADREAMDLSDKQLENGIDHLLNIFASEVSREKESKSIKDIVCKFWKFMDLKGFRFPEQHFDDWFKKQ